MLYQHNTPYAETLETLDELYRAGHFSSFGLSSYSAWEVAQICELCDRHGWKKPDVYQGSYNALQRRARALPLPTRVWHRLLLFQPTGWWLAHWQVRA